MTFILAIQLKDSTIIASDKRSATIGQNGQFEFDQDRTNKLNLWQSGVITGVGELTVIQRAVAFLELLANSNIDQLVNCIELSRLIRNEEHSHPQIDQTKLIYSHCDDKGVKLYAIERENSEYVIRKFEEDEISIWMYNPDISVVSEKIKLLYRTLRPLSSFTNVLTWINYYVSQINGIFYEQSKHDRFMSSSFDIYFQTTDEFYIGTIEGFLNKKNSYLSAIK